MRTPLLLLKYAGKTAAHLSGFGFFADLATDFFPELANNLWNDWSGDRTPAERRADLEALAQASDEEVRLDVDAIFRELAETGEPVPPTMTQWLRQIPRAVRQTLRRPTDPTGRTVTPALEPHSADDMLKLLPTRLPQFKPGDRPLPGVDWVLIEPLGTGGFGEVWKARHTSIEAIPPVALKFCTDPEAKQRLLTHEATICARVLAQGRHPGIVQLQQTYLSADPPCLQYEYIEGGDLTGLIRQWHGRDKRPEPKHMAQAVLRISEVVAFAHRLEPPIVHRDLKPANILVHRTKHGVGLKIADFGIGGIATAQAIRETGRGTSSGTLRTVAVRGAYTPNYASPEQMRPGSPPDPRDDVHALGVIWFQMLTGDLTQGRPSGGSAWKRRLVERGMTPALVEVLESCFEDRDDRPPDAAVLTERLKAVLDASPPTSVPPAPLSTPTTSAPVMSPSRPTLAPPQTTSTPAMSELRRLEGHTDGVNSVVFSPDGRRALSGGLDGTARVWDVETGRETLRLEADTVKAITDTVKVLSVAFAPDGRRALSGGFYGTARMWDVETGRETLRLWGHRDQVFSVAFSPDGRRALSGGWDHTVRLWDVETGRETLRLKGHTSAVLSVVFSPDGRRALSGGWDRTARVWDVETGQELHRFEGHGGLVLSVAFSPDGRRALSGGTGSTVRLWDVETGQELRRFEGHGHNVFSVAFLADGRRALSGGDDGMGRLWDIDSGRELSYLRVTGCVKSVAFAPDGRYALSAGSYDKTVRLWALPEV